MVRSTRNNAIAVACTARIPRRVPSTFARDDLAGRQPPGRGKCATDRDVGRDLYPGAGQIIESIREPWEPAGRSGDPARHRCRPPHRRRHVPGIRRRPCTLIASASSAAPADSHSAVGRGAPSAGRSEPGGYAGIRPWRKLTTRPATFVAQRSSSSGTPLTSTSWGRGPTACGAIYYLVPVADQSVRSPRGQTIPPWRPGACRR
jgi:hypothetical protein